MVMANVLSTNKPWALLVFALCALNAIVAFTAVAGMETPLDQLATGQSIVPMAEEQAPTQGAPVATISGAAILSLALWVIVLYGLWQGHAWSWWLLSFNAIIAVATAVIGLISGQGLAIGIVTFIVNLVLIAALLHKQTVGVYEPNLKILPADGVWGQA
jgi:hypothetical protein